MKVIEKIGGASDDGVIVFSFEFFTPKLKKNSNTSSGVDDSVANAFAALVSRMASHGPTFCDITWRPSEPYPALTLNLAGRMQNQIGVETMLHLTCVGMPLDQIDLALDTARNRGIRNILALRGDLPGHNAGDGGGGDGEGELTCALDLVEHIRARHGDYFGIAIAGYPEAHPCKIPEGSEVATAEGYWSDLAYLKRKVEAGADLIITQLFFDVEVFIRFVGDCRQIGISCPIVPGILPITSYKSFRYMTETCRTRVPTEVREAVEAAREDEGALTAYGVGLATEMCQRILKSGLVRALHFYTMNKEAPPLAVLHNLGVLGGADGGNGKYSNGLL